MFQCVQIIAKCSQVRYLQRNQIDVGGHRTGNLLGCVSIFIAVSYTHLDVYKRQGNTYSYVDEEMRNRLQVRLITRTLAFHVG